MRKHFLFCLLPIILVVVLGEAQQVRIKRKIALAPKDVAGACSTRWASDCWASLAILAARNPYAYRVRMVSHDTAGSGHEEFELYFDRRATEVRTRDCSGQSALGGWSYQSDWRRALYENVDDNILHNFLVEFAPLPQDLDKATDDKFEAFALKHGCHIKVLSSAPVVWGNP